MDSCFKASILNLAMEILIQRKMLSSKVIENLTKLWRIQMMQLLDSINSTRYMLRKSPVRTATTATKLQPCRLLQEIAKKRLLSIKS
jgi:hypothetical protein